MSGGLFVTLEGPEGSGKTTQQRRLCRALERAGRDCVCTREPGGGTPAAEAVRRVLLDPDCWPALGLAEVFLYAAARADHLEQVVEPALARGAVVLCDRFLDSTLAYQGYGRGRPLAVIRALHDLPPLDRRPDLTLLLDVDPAEGRKRTLARREGGHDPEAAGYDDAEQSFHRRVREGFLELARAEPGRIRVIDASLPEAEVSREALRHLGAALGLALPAAP